MSLGASTAAGASELRRPTSVNFACHARANLRLSKICENISSPNSLVQNTRISRPRKVSMQRRTTSWYSANLNMEMPLVSYGHAGPPLLMFPTAAADYLEYERFHLVDAIKQFLDAGKVRAYSINSVNRYSLLNEDRKSTRLNSSH